MLLDTVSLLQFFDLLPKSRLPHTCVPYFTVFLILIFNCKSLFFTDTREMKSSHTFFTMLELEGGAVMFY